MTCVTYAADGWGTGAVWTDQTGRVLFHELPRESPHPGWGPHPPPSLPRTLARKSSRVRDASAPEVRRFVHSLEAYFAGEDVSFDGVDLDLDWCTPFQRAAAEALRRVPRGEVVTYAELAALVGRLPAIAVKLNGVTAKTKPSSGRYSIRFQTPCEETGCSS